MYDIYIKNYYSPSDGKLVKDETRLYSIPIVPEDYDNILSEPSVSSEMGKTGTFEFTVYPNHPYYHSFAHMRTIMRVVYDGDTIFRGRVLTIDNNLTGNKKIHCEGDMAFLLDSIQEATKEETRSKIKLGKYIENVLNAHNKQMEESGETDKQIFRGKIPGSYTEEIEEDQKIKNDEQKFGSGSFENTMNALETLTSNYGGYFKTRYDEETGKCYLDWTKQWFRRDPENSQPIAVTRNMIDAQSNSEVDNIFTALIPIGNKDGENLFIDGYKTDIHGNNKRILVPHITKVFSEKELAIGHMTKEIYENAVNDYGIIYKTQSFSNASTKAKLWEYACDWIKNNYVGGITSYDLTAVDMHHVDNSVVKYLVGDRINLTIPVDATGHDEYASSGVTSGNTTIERTLTSIKYVLHNPEKNSYTAGVPCDILNREYGAKSTSKSKTGGGGGKGAGGKAGGGNNHHDDQDREEAERQRNLDQLAYKYVLDAKHNSAEYQALYAKDPNKGSAALKSAKLIVKGILDDPNFGQNEYNSMVLDGQKGKVMAISPTTGEAILTDPVLAKKAQNDPRFFKIVTGQAAFTDAVNSLVLNSVDKTIAVRGSNKMTNEQVVAALSDVDINEEQSDEEAQQVVADALAAEGGPAGAAVTAVMGSTGMGTGDGEAGFMGLSAEMPSSPEEATEAVTNVLLDSGGNGGSGSASVGREGNEGPWLIQMNKPLQYKVGDEIYTLPKGTIDVKDIAMLKAADRNPIPSFSTKVALIEQAFVVELTAVKADIGDLTAKYAKIDTIVANSISSYFGSIKQLNVNGTLTANSLGAYDLSCYTDFTYKGEKVSYKTAYVMLSNGSTAYIRYIGTN